MSAVGELFIADSVNHRIRKVDEAGTITTVAGDGTKGYCGDGGPATLACLNGPSDVAVDGAGNIFIADSSNHRIRKVDATGTIATVAGNGTAAFCGDGGPATSACLQNPSDIAVGGAGDLFIADSSNNRIRKVGASGTITTVAGNGTAGFCGDGGPATSACLYINKSPASVAVDATGTLFIADSGNLRVRKVNSAGTITTVAGGATNYGYGCDRDQLATKMCLHPVGVEVDALGDLFIVDWYPRARIRKVDAMGMLATVAGNGPQGFCGDGSPAANACLLHSEGVAVDATGALFIADTGNERIRKVVASFSLTLSPPVVSGCLKSTGKVTLSAPAPAGGLVVMLSSDNSHAVVPPSLTLKAGAVVKTFPIQTSAVAATETATITARGGGSTRSATLTLKPMVLKSLVLAPNPVVGGSPSTGTVTMECPAGPGDIVVTLSSSMPAIAWPATPTVTVLRTASTASFTVRTSPVAVVKKPSIKATTRGVTKSKTLIVNPTESALLGPLPYLKFADSPFKGLTFTYWHLENFEDHLFNVPGVTANVGGVCSKEFGPAGHDSVDADDGVIDGLGLAGDDYWARATGITFTFNAAVLGSLPTHVGLVWTDGEVTTTTSFEAFDAAGASLGVIGPVAIADDTYNGTTAEDRFFGVIHYGGISKITILDSPVGPFPGIEIDHLQYGRIAPAAPTTLPAGSRPTVAGGGPGAPRTQGR